MTRKNPRVDAYVDESIRGQTYYLCAVLVPVREQAKLRQILRHIASQSGHRRIHFHNESSKRKSEVLGCICDHVEVVIVHTQIGHGKREEDARKNCLWKLIRELQSRKIQFVTLEQRTDNRSDEIVIHQARLNGPQIEFIHASPYDEPLLWCPDAIAWTYGAGSMWEARIENIPIQDIHLT